MTEVFPRPLLMSIYNGIVYYRYRGVPCLKSPFDFAILTRLLWDVRPRTIIEVGTNAGGSALWLADQLKVFRIDGVVHSVDNHSDRPNDPGDNLPQQDNIKYYVGDARNLEATFSPEWVAAQPRPILVNEDSDHTADSSLAVLRWFNSFAEVGEYIVVEDGNTNEIIPGGHPCGGPLAGVDAFIKETGDKYIIDRQYCDMFGPNVTYFPDGYIRRQK